MDNQIPNSPSIPSTSALPPISQLFTESWQVFTKSILKLFLLNIFGILIYLGTAILGVVIFILSGVGSSLLQKGLPGLINLFSSPQGLIITVIISIILFVVFFVVSTALQIASILIVDNQGKVSVIDTFKNSFGFIIPLSLVGILTFLLTFGAFFVLILPAIIVYFLLSFAQYEVILNNQRWTEAVKRSVTIVSKHFGAILIRLMLPILIYIAYSIITNLISKTGSNVATLIGILTFIINLFLGWFVLVYTVTLYKQARAGLEQEPGKGIRWMWVVAIIGWLIAIGIFFFGYQALSSRISQNRTANSFKTSQTISTNSSSLVKSAQGKLNQAIDISIKQNATQKENTQKIQLLATAYSELKTATIQDPLNPQAWFYLGEVEKLLKNPTAAKADLSKALQLLDKNDPMRPTLEKELNSL